MLLFPQNMERRLQSFFQPCIGCICRCFQLVDWIVRAQKPQKATKEGEDFLPLVCVVVSPWPRSPQFKCTIKCYNNWLEWLTNQGKPIKWGCFHCIYRPICRLIYVLATLLLLQWQNWAHFYWQWKKTTCLDWLTDRGIGLGRGGGLYMALMEGPQRY